MRIYEKNGKKYISVTTLVGMKFPFEASGFNKWAYEHGYDPDWITKESTDRGTRYHAYLENRFYGISDWADVIVDDKDRRYHEAVEKFFNDGWEIIESEVEVYNDDWHYAGRFDFLIKNSRMGIEKALGDCKTFGAWKGAKYKRDKKKLDKLSMQMTLYENAIGEQLPKYGVMLDGTGNYTIEEIQEDTGVWDWLRENRNEYIKLLVDKND